MKQTILRYELPLALAALAAVAVWLALAVTAQAHANLARATPEPGSVVQTAPARVTGWFTETMEPAFSKMQVLDSSGARVDLDDSGVDASDATSMSVGLPDGLPNGTYAVVWNNLSTVDGHTLRGAFVFHIGEPSGGAAVELDSEPPLLQSQADPFVRWLVLLGAFAAIGGAGFYLLVAGPVLTGKRAEPAFRETGRMLARRSAQLGAGGVALLLAASIGQLVLQAIKLDSGVGTVIGGTEWGALWASRVGLGVAMGVALVVLARGRPSRRAGTPTMATVAALALGVGLLLTVSLASHAAALREARSAAIFSDFLHLAATALWVGGLMHLALSGLLLLRHVPESMRTAMLARVVPRFSVLAVLCVGTLVVTGIFAAWAQVSSPGAVATPYGWTLVAKTALVAPLFALGAANLLFTTPRLAKGRDGDAWLRRLVAGEVALAVLALLAVGYLTSMEPARQTAARAAQEAGTRYEETAQGTRVSAEVSPGRVGVNTLEVTLRDVLDRPITNASPVRARITYLDQDLGSEFQDLTNAGGGRYTLDGVTLSVAGAWQAEVAASRPDAFDARVAFRFEVASGGGAVGTAPMESGSGKVASLLLGVELVVLAVLLLAVAMPVGALRSRMGTAFIGVGLVLFFTGGFFALNAGGGTGDPDASGLVSPVLPDAASIARGAELYTQNCVTCHGVLGHGDGPAAAGLQPPPLDLTVHVPLHPDRALFLFIRDGVPGTAMPVWGDTLSDEDIWHLVNFIKTLPEQARQTR